MKRSRDTIPNIDESREMVALQRLRNIEEKLDVIIQSNQCNQNIEVDNTKRIHARGYGKYRIEKSIGPDDILNDTSASGCRADQLVPRMTIQFSRGDLVCNTINSNLLRTGELVNITGPDFTPERMRICKSDKAIVCLFYGRNPEVVSPTLVMGYQLRQKHENENVDICLMIVGNVEQTLIRSFSCFFSIIRVDPISPGNSSWTRGMNAKSHKKMERCLV